MNNFSYAKCKTGAFKVLLVLTVIAVVLSVVMISCSACLSSRIILGVYILLVGLFHAFIIQALFPWSFLYGLIFMLAVIFGIPLVETLNPYLYGVLGFGAFVLSICFPIIVTGLPLSEYVRLMYFWGPMECVYMPEKDLNGNIIKTNDGGGCKDKDADRIKKKER